RQRGKEHLHRRLPGILALCARRALHPRHALPAQGHRRHAPAGACPARGIPQGQDRRGGEKLRRRGRTSGGGVTGMNTLVQNAKPSSILYLDGVSVSFDGFKALNALSFVIEPGELRAIIGPNGAGKTTMMDIITGKTKPDEGEVFFEGNIDLTRKDEADIAQIGIGRKFQKPTVFESHSVWDNIELALDRKR